MTWLQLYLVGDTVLPALENPAVRATAVEPLKQLDPLAAALNQVQRADADVAHAVGMGATLSKLDVSPGFRATVDCCLRVIAVWLHMCCITNIVAKNFHRNKCC